MVTHGPGIGGLRDRSGVGAEASGRRRGGRSRAGGRNYVGDGLLASRAQWRRDRVSHPSGLGGLIRSSPAPAVAERPITVAPPGFEPGSPNPEPSPAGLFGGHHVRKWLPAK